MADSVWEPDPAPVRHSALVRATHWINALCFFALLVSGVEILISHPRFYWGEAGNVNTQPLFQIPIPASRAIVPTGYGYVLPDQNGWSRALHFQSAWLIFFTGCIYVLSGFVTRHFQRDLLPASKDFSWPSLLQSAASDDPSAYNVLQRLAYLAVVFLLLPLLVWTGVAMAPVFTSAWPGLVTALGGRQSARTLHFFLSLLLTGFFLGHVLMVWRAGLVSRVRAMLTGRLSESKEDV